MARNLDLASPDRRTAVRGRASAMRRVLATVALAGIAALATPGARAQSTDSWVGADKAKHFGMSAPLGMFGSALIPRDATLSQRVMYGTLLGSLPGLAKELSDYGRPGSTPSARDMAFNVLGAALGASLAECCLIRPFARGDRVDGVGVEYRIEF